MDVRQLRYFLTVAEERNFTRAAALLNVAQSALSQQILALERELSMKLFTRTTRHVELTEAGREMLVGARRVVRAFDTTREYARELASGDVGRLRLGFVASSAYGLLPPLLLAHRATYPRVHLELQELTTVQQLEALRTGDLDVGIGRDLAPRSDLEIHHLVDEPLIVALPARHPLASTQVVACAALSQEPFIMLPREQIPQLTQLIDSLCRSAGFAIGSTLEAGQFTTILALVAADLGISIVPSAVCTFQPAGLVYRPLRENVSSSVQLLTDSQQASPVAQRFVDFALRTSGSGR